MNGSNNKYVIDKINQLTHNNLMWISMVCGRSNYTYKNNYNEMYVWV